VQPLYQDERLGSIALENTKTASNRTLRFYLCENPHIAF
jgi:hypothetical protein